MQYFSFLGKGAPNKGYSDAIYCFENSKNEYISKFIQSVVYEEYQDDIDCIFIFCTEESKKCNGEQLEKELKMKAKGDLEIKFIQIPNTPSLEDIISEMEKYIKSDFIVDVTHSFRNIPLVFTMIIRYVEMVKGYSMQHLFYGFFNNATETGKIVDLKQQYDQSMVINEIDAFDKYLKASMDSVTQYKKDKEISRLLNSFIEFNNMIEYCDFQRCVSSVRKIVDCSKSILKEKNKYILIIPYVNKIIDKFEPVERTQQNALKKIEIIRILLNHNYMQVAITFTDQLIRDELIHYSYFKETRDFKSKLLEKIELCEDNVYDLSQDLLFYLRIRENQGTNNSRKKIIKTRDRYFNLEKNVDLLNPKAIDSFYSDIRNHINHGMTIDKSISVNKVIDQCLKGLYRFIKEGS